MQRYRESRWKKQIIVIHSSSLLYPQTPPLTLFLSFNMEDHVEVARGFDDVKKIDETKDIWTLAVRIVDIWSVISKYRSEHLEMIVMDSQGDMIQVTVPKEFVSEFKDMLLLNKTYEMENFKVNKNDLVVKACLHAFRLTVTGATVITSQDFPDIPISNFRFKDFGELLAGKYRPDLLVDVIGAFQEVTNTNRSGGRLRAITFTLKDASENVVHCCLWDDHAKQCSDAFSKFDGREPVIVIVKHARIKPEQGNYPLCFTNTWDGTQVLINPDLPEIAEFKSRFEALPSHAIVESQSLSQFSQSSQFSQNPDIMSRATFLSLSEINSLQHETVCVTVAEITKLNATRHGWTYDGCNHCTMVVKMFDGKFKCNNEHVNEKPLPRYKVEVQVVHKSEKARFLIWDNDCASILKISAAELREQMIKAGHTNPRTYPKVLDNLLSKKKVFKVKALPGSNPCSVIQISDSQQLLANLEKQFGLEETSSTKEHVCIDIISENKDTSIVPATSLSQEPVVLGMNSENKDTSINHSGSLCGENDLSLTSSTPPAKRLSLEHTDSATQADSLDVQLTQLSSTKMKKPPKNAKTPKLER